MILIRWQTKYGDFEFKRDKFPNIKDLILNLNDLGFRTTLWIHPFTNLDSENFFKIIQNNYNVRGLDGSDIGLTFWWDGINAVIIDPTNPNASDWFVAQLEKIRNESKIDSFKFDAG
jgi:alpha-glucosidase (family GH31 glycosyl hydrolase)